VSEQPKRPPRYAWTPEEIEILRRHGHKASLADLAKMLKKASGIQRTHRGIALQRRRLDPNWDIGMPGMVSLISISGLGAKLKSVNERAFRKAKEDGVMRHQLIRGRLAAVVPVKWADAWIAAEEENSRRHDELRNAGWYYTTEIAKMLGVNRRYCIVCLRNKNMGNGEWRMFRGVESVKLIGKPILWEPNATRIAVAAFVKNRAIEQAKRAKGSTNAASN
jgi:hypothetical protein